MVEHSVPRLTARPLVLGLLLLVAAVAPAAAQDRATADRLDRIERDLNMLQRQVYRGAPTLPPAGPGGAPPANAADVEIRMERLEAQMRDLTGRVEEVANGLDQLKQRVEQINSDLDVRLNEITGGATAGAPPGRSAAAGSPPAAGSPNRIATGPAPPPTGGLMPPGTVVPPPGSGGPGSGGPAPIFNTLSPPGVPPAISERPPPAAAPASAEGGLPAGSPNEQFNYAFGLVKQRDYDGAEEALKAFIQRHPNDPLAGSAHYWLGETYFVRNQYGQAATAFAEGYKRFPKGPKAPETLLELGRSLARADQKKNACLALGQLEQAFPNSSPAIREKANAEKKRIGCA